MHTKIFLEITKFPCTVYSNHSWYCIKLNSIIKERTYSMFDKCKVTDGGTMCWKFLEFGVLKRVRSESVKSFVSHGSCKQHRHVQFMLQLLTNMVAEPMQTASTTQHSTEKHCVKLHVKLL